MRYTIHINGRVTFETKSYSELLKVFAKLVVFFIKSRLSGQIESFDGDQRLEYLTWDSAKVAKAVLKARGKA